MVDDPEMPGSPATTGPRRHVEATRLVDDAMPAWSPSLSQVWSFEDQRLLPVADRPRTMPVPARTTVENLLDSAQHL